ncbi:MAG: hypothetical protein Q8S27_07865, partial [Hoeflea sp.]|nr:hypothetical protein [Hoeflea sp.]
MDAVVLFQNQRFEDKWTASFNDLYGSGDRVAVHLWDQPPSAGQCRRTGQDKWPGLAETALLRRPLRELAEIGHFHVTVVADQDDAV